MTRGKLIAMLQTSAASLNALGSKAPTSPAQPADPADTQVANYHSAGHPPDSGGNSCGTADGWTDCPQISRRRMLSLTNALTDTLAGVHIQIAKASDWRLRSTSAVSRSIFCRLSCKIIQSILLQNTGTAIVTPTPAPAPAVAKPEAIEPRRHQ